jgi:hypothetical protein
MACTACEAPFSSLAFKDDGLILAAETNTGRVVFYDVHGKPQPLTIHRAYHNSEAVTSLCWQRSKPILVNEANCSLDFLSRIHFLLQQVYPMVLLPCQLLLLVLLDILISARQRVLQFLRMV